MVIPTVMLKQQLFIGVSADTLLYPWAQLLTQLFKYYHVKKILCFETRAKDNHHSKTAKIGKLI